MELLTNLCADFFSSAVGNDVSAQDSSKNLWMGHDDACASIKSIRCKREKNVHKISVVLASKSERES